MTEILDAWRVLMVAFPNWDVPPETVAMWTELLADIPAHFVLAGAMSLAQESKYPPSLAEWRSRSLTCAGKGSAHTTSVSAAWDEVMGHRVRFGQTCYNAEPYKPCWSSEAVRRAAEAVRWRDRNWTTEQIPMLRAQFERYYATHAAKQSAMETSTRVLALVERVSATYGVKNASSRTLLDVTASMREPVSRA